MKHPGLCVFIVRAYDSGLASRTASIVQSGLIEQDEDGNILHEAMVLYQWQDDTAYIFQRLEQWLEASRQIIQRNYEEQNSDEGADEGPVDLVIHLSKVSHPQIVLEIRKTLERYFPDTDTFSVADITVKVDPERMRDYDDSFVEECKQFQHQLFT